VHRARTVEQCTTARHPRPLIKVLPGLHARIVQLPVQPPLLHRRPARCNFRYTAATLLKNNWSRRPSQLWHVYADCIRESYLAFFEVADISSSFLSFFRQRERERERKRKREKTCDEFPETQESLKEEKKKKRKKKRKKGSNVSACALKSVRATLFGGKLESIVHSRCVVARRRNP